MASAILRRVSTLITIASATDGNSVGLSNIPKTSLTIALSSPIGYMSASKCMSNELSSLQPSTKASIAFSFLAFMANIPF